MSTVHLVHLSQGLGFGVWGLGFGVWGYTVCVIQLGKDSEKERYNPREDVVKLFKGCDLNVVVHESTPETVPVQWFRV